jgi:hypothetical protein
MMSQLIKRHFLMEVRVVEDEKKPCLLNHFNLCIKSGDDTTNIETLYFQTVFDICISDKFLDKDQSFQDTLCHKHYNIFSHSEKSFLIV